MKFRQAQNRSIKMTLLSLTKQMFVTSNSFCTPDELLLFVPEKITYLAQAVEVDVFLLKVTQGSRYNRITPNISLTTSWY